MKEYKNDILKLCLSYAISSIFIAFLIIFVSLYEMKYLIVGLVFTLLGIFLFYPRVIAEFKQVVKINESLILFESYFEKIKNSICDIEIPYDAIQCLTYKGVNSLFFGSLVIETHDEWIDKKGKRYRQKIYVSTLYKNYLSLWADIINACERNNPDIKIDEQLYKRTKK